MKRLILSALAIIVFLTGLGAGKSLAQEEDMPNPWTIDGYNAVAYIDIDGSVTIEEYITFKFTREFDGVLKRQLDTTGATSLDDFSIYKAVDIDDEDITKSELEEIKKDSYRLAADEEYGMVNGVDITLGVEAKEMTLLYKYKLKDLIGIYNDGALFNWTFIDDMDNPGEGDMSIKVVLPKGVNLGSVQSFLQGPLYIQETKEDNIITFDTNHIVEKQGLKLSLLLPASHISEGRKRIENNIAGKITGDINEYNDMMDGIRRQYERRNKAVRSIGGIGAGILVLLLIFIYLKYDRDPDAGISQKYANELPADYYTPAELGVLLNRGRVRKEYIVATLIDLVNRGYLDIKPSETEEAYILSKNAKTKAGGLKSHEDYILAWFFDDFGWGRDEISTKDIEKWAKGPANKARYRGKYRIWSKLVTKQASKWNFIENTNEAKLYGFILGIIGLAPSAILFVLGDIFKGAIVLVLSLSLAIYSRFIFKRTEFGVINHVQWRNFKRYIQNPTESGLETPKPSDWEKGLAYAVVMGAGGDVITRTEELFKDRRSRDSGLFLLDGDNLDKTANWIESLGGQNQILERMGKTFSQLRLGGISIDKKG